MNIGASVSLSAIDVISDALRLALGVQPLNECETLDRDASAVPRIENSCKPKSLGAGSAPSVVCARLRHSLCVERQGTLSGTSSSSHLS